MELDGRRLEGQDPHKAGLELLEALYRKAYGSCLPEIRRTAAGKPYFPDKSCHFSITHSKNHVFCCLSDRPVGIDAEEMDRNISLRLASRILSPGEQERLNAAPDRRAALLRLWVLKEAQAKCSGRGLGTDSWRTDFSPEDPRILQIDGCYVAIIEEEQDAL